MENGKSMPTVAFPTSPMNLASAGRATSRFRDTCSRSLRVLTEQISSRFSTTRPDATQVRDPDLLASALKSIPKTSHFTVVRFISPPRSNYGLSSCCGLVSRRRECGLSRDPADITIRLSRVRAWLQVSPLEVGLVLRLAMDALIAQVHPVQFATAVGVEVVPGRLQPSRRVTGAIVGRGHV